MYKKEPYNANWQQLSRFTTEEMNYSTFMEITGKMAGQKNLLFIFEFTANKEKMLGLYFTFGQLEQQQTEKKQTPN